MSASSAEPAASAAPATGARRGLLAFPIKLFSSVRFGIVLMTILFFYCSVGSAGIIYPASEGWVHDHFRQWRAFEMTEFEWFHWWPFDLLMALIGINIAVTTVRKIPLKAVNYGVWGIHTGILIMMAGCWIYFGTKVEGDAPVVRRQVLAELLAPAAAGAAPTVVASQEFIASPGARISLSDGTRKYDLEISSIDPDWMMRSAEAESKAAYSVNVMVRRAGGAPDDGVPASYMRQLLAGYPDHTEDVIPSGDPQQPMQRAIKAVGKPTIDDGLRLTLDYAPAKYFYLRMELEKAWAMYIRKAGETEWIERPIRGMPLYNDYVGDRNLVFQDAGDPPVPLQPINVSVPASDPKDPLKDVTFTVNGYLRYAMTQTNVREGSPQSPLNPVVDLLVTAEGGQRQSYRLAALDPTANKAEEGILQARFVASEEAFNALLNPPTLRFRMREIGVDVRVPIKDLAGANRDAPFQPVPMPADAPKEQTCTYRVIAVQEDIGFSSGASAVAVVELQTPKGAFRRWVFADPALTRDVTDEFLKDPHAPTVIGDPSVEIFFEPGRGQALVTMAVGPQPERLRLISGLSEPAKSFDVSVGKAVLLPGGIVVTPTGYLTRAVVEQKPMIVPRERRERDAGVQFSQILVDIPGAGTHWLRYHPYVFDAPRDVLRRFPYQPERITLQDGSAIEVMFSRQRLPLPAGVALDEFVLTTHVGGFTGEMGSIRDYKSMVRFRDEGSTAWTEPVAVSMNAPVEYAGLAYFQSQWDPPDQPRFEGDRGSRGLNYTVLGVGNRHGVWTMLIGVCISVIGMCYAFYVKPVLKRRQREAVYASVGKRPAQEVAS
jgi:hypothetical protein